MASIQSIGIGSNILTNDLIDQLVDAEKVPATNKLDREQELLEFRQEALGEVSSALSKIENSLSSLASASTFSRNTATSSNESVARGTASTLAGSGTYNLNVTQLAESHSIASKAGAFSSVDDVIGTGTIQIQFGNYTDADNDWNNGVDGFTQNTAKDPITINLDSSNNTLSGLRDAINDAGVGVTATIVNAGGTDGYRLLLTSEDTGESSAMRLTSSTTTGDLSVFDFNETTQEADTTIQAQSAAFKLNGMNVTSESNQVTEAIKGVTLTLEDVGNATLSVSRDTDQLSEKINGFVEAYNEFRDLVKNYTKYDTDTGQAGVLIGDFAVNTISRQVSGLISKVIPGREDSSVRSLADIGLGTDRHNDFKLTFDSAKFAQKMASSEADVVALFATQGTATDSGIQYIGASSATKEGTYDVNVTQTASQGYTKGADLSAFFPYTPTAADNGFKINVDGIVSNLLELDTSATYNSGDELAAALQDLINQDTKLGASGKQVTVEFGADNKLTITSSKEGSGSFVTFDEVEAAGGLFGFQADNSLLAGSSLGGAPTLTVDDTNNSFRINVNGTLSDELTLNKGTYTDMDSMATLLQATINGDSKLQSKNETVTVTWNTDHFEIQADKSGDGKFTQLFSIGDQGGNTSNTFHSTFGFEGVGGQDASALITDAATAKVSDMVYYGDSLTSLNTISAGTPLDLSGSASSTFRVSVNGTESNTIDISSLDAGHGAGIFHSATELAQTLNIAINSDANLSDPDADPATTYREGLQVSYNAEMRRLEFKASNVLASGEISFTALGADALANLGVSTERNATAITTGTQQEVTARGNFFNIESGNAKGLMFMLTNGNAGDRGSLTYTQGIASRITDVIGGALSRNTNSPGIFGSRLNQLDQELIDLNEERTELNERMDTMRDRLSRQFTTQDIIVSRLNSTFDFLKSQFEAMNAQKD
ncbi:flagellar hook-associated protein 2 [Allopseudospirillum japonicum]|uniref:Filament cap protein n=1 Tax=Allopseudospirillum japonicum TaxID=64971 RepID=A0A1H6TE97_9GAMM|nr:flagellar filament capping protein FliD [Allopseudospirillum japonicum]SEI78321.1 flagellar hook-associated protein 2 [Allopseudospirillum japonicum]